MGVAVIVNRTQETGDELAVEPGEYVRVTGLRDPCDRLGCGVVQVLAECPVDGLPESPRIPMKPRGDSNGWYLGIAEYFYLYHWL